MFLRKTTVPLQGPPPSAPSKSPCYKPATPQGTPSSSNNNNSSHHAQTGPGLPVLGRMDPSHVTAGTNVWLPDAKMLWRMGQVQSVANDQHTAHVHLQDDTLQSLPLSKLYAFDPSHVLDHDDIAQMNNMHEAPLLHVLRQRFEADKIYTFTADILLSINPYKTIPLLYDVLGFMDQHGAKAGASLVDEAASKRPPHLFTIAEKAYRGMKGTVAGSGTPQSIIVSGESGAGKTEASKYIMKYLATASKHAAETHHCTSSSTTKATTSVHEKIEGCVVLSNLILESFGNAKTSRNDNSSRFGKYIQIHYNAEGRMAGVSIRHFLLEKTRLVVPQASERNYHVFYQLLAGLKTLGSAEQARLQLTDNVWNYVYLTRGDCVDVDGVDDAAEFEQLCKCMDQLGMDKVGFQMPLLELLAAILHLGNLQFETSKSNNSDDTSVPTFPEAARGVDLELVASLLGVDASEFAKKMVTQTTVTGRGSILEMKLTPEQAKNAMDAFCKYLYGELFHHVIARINQYAKEQTSLGYETSRASKTSTSKASAAMPFIGILDIFGFEVMKKNSLEQLCINFTNETLQQQFNKHVFVLEQERYASEGIAFSTVEYKDNQPCLDLIQKPPLGLLPLLEEQMLLKRKTTDKQLLTIYHGTHLDRHAHYAKPRFECDEFVVRHYAGDVVYDINEFIGKNTDNLHDDLLDLLRRSEQPLLKAMFAGVAEPMPAKRSNVSLSSSSSSSSSASSSSSTAGGKRSQGAALTGTTTVSSRFRTQLTELMDVLWHTSPNYIKCIKPNNLKFPGGFSCELVRDQLVYSGVLEVVRIRQEGFPIRQRFDVFYERFWPLGTSHVSPSTIQKDPKRVRDVSEWIAAEWLVGKPTDLAMGTEKRSFAMGRHEVFLRYGQVEKLEAYTTALRSTKAMVLQSRLLGWKARKAYQTIRKGVVQCQAQWRMRRQQAQYTEIRSAALLVQTAFRCVRVQKRFRRIKLAASVISRTTRRFLTHIHYRHWKVQHHAAVEIQKHVRGYLMRTAAERKRKLQQRSAVAVQSWYKMTQQQRVYRRFQTAAVHIQSKYRALVARRAFLRAKHASIVLEAFVRQCLARRKFRHLKRGIVQLQALVRQWKHYKSYQARRKAVVVLQSKRRQRDARQVALRRLQALRTLQHAMRGWRQRCQYLVMQRSARVVQGIVKRWHQQKEFRLLKAATTRIQSRWRLYHRTQVWRAEVAILFRLPKGGAAGGGTTSGGPVSPSSRNHAKIEDSDRRVERLRANPSLYFHLRPQAFGYNTLFLHAAQCGDFHVVKYMLDATPTVTNKRELYESHNAQGHTAFHLACAYGQYDMAKFLLKYAKTAYAKPALPTKRVNGVPVNKEVAEHGPEQDAVSTTLLPPVGVQLEGFLKKRRETSRWMKRYVVLSVSAAHTPQLAYYANDKPATLQAESAKTIDLTTALFKKSMDVPFAFEIHSPKLLQGRNREGRLYFAGENELEIQKWLAQLRNVIPSSIESRLFAMHRGNKHGTLEFIDFALCKQLCSTRARSATQETPLHLVAGALLHTGPGVPHAHSSLEIAVSASAISVTLDVDDIHHHHIQQQSRVPSSSDDLHTHATKSRLDAEADLVKTALWLVENGADINALTTGVHNVSPMKLALHAKNYLVAKYLLDRGALATGLSETELDELQRIKAALTKNAISSVTCSASSSMSRTSSLRTLGSFTKKKSLAAMVASSSGSDAATLSDHHVPILFLQKQPGKVRNSSYVSVFVELLAISNPQYLSRPRMIVSVLDAQSHLVEPKQQVSVQPLVLHASLVWSFTWHMQTPLENLPHGACVVLELTISPTLSSSSGAIAAASATDFVPVCWTYIQVDQRTANSMALNAEMYKYPMDLTLTKLQRVDAFVTGDIFISQGPQ